VLWLHVVGLTLFAWLRGYDLIHALGHGAPLVVLACMAMAVKGNRRAAAAFVSLGLISSSALLVHSWDGVIEGHFHFFVMIALLTLYEDWFPFLLAAAYVVVHHGLMGALDPGGVYNHPDAVAHPWKWAAIHGGFVVAAGTASVVAWRLNENVRVAQIKDIAERRRAEESLRESRELLAEAQKLAQLGSWEWSLETGEVTWSEELYRIFGLDPEIEVSSYSKFFERVHPDERRKVEAIIDRSLARREPFHEEMQIIRADEAVRIIDAHGQVALDTDGNPEKMVGTAQDVTERRMVERKLALQEEAEKEHRARSDFLSRISHELRTPLNSILGFAQLMEMDDLDPVQRDNVGLIIKGGNHLLQLINEVLEISRIEAGTMTVSLEPVQVGSSVGEVLNLLEPLAAEHGVTLENDVAPDCEDHVQADAQRLKQVLLNLVSNAIKYNKQHGSVRISLESPSADRTLILVTDTGHGISEENQAKLFTPFDRLGADETAIEGTGLGLALSKLLTEAMGGTLAVESEPWIGSTFTVGLASAAGPAAHEQGAEQAVPATAANGSAETETVLYVEDNKSNLQLVERILAKRPQVKLLSAMDGPLGVELARQHEPALILLDLHLPGMDGEEVLKHLKADERTARIPVVVVSADATNARVERLLAGGAEAFLTKPLQVSRFMSLVDSTLDHEAAA
jgi:PAS domain S-box-containing protein